MRLPHGKKSTMNTQERTPETAGAMTQAMRAVSSPHSGPKVLRVGVIQEGKIIEERVLPSRRSLFVGTSESNDFIVHGAELPARFELFESTAGGYRLHLRDGMRGRVGASGVTRELSGSVVLAPDARGKVVMGDVTLLFQFVVPPPAVLRPQLPSAARGGFAAGIDWLFTSFVVFSYMLFFGFVVVLESADWKVVQSLDVDPDYMARLVFAEPEPPPEITPEVENDDAVSEETEVADTTSTERTERTHPDTPRDTAPSAETVARIQEQAMAAAESLAIAALGPDGSLANLLDGGALTESAEQILAQTNGVQLATSESSQLRVRDGGNEGSGGNRDIGTLVASNDAGQQVATSDVTERVIGRATFAPDDGGEEGGMGVFDSALVVRGIRGRLRRIQNCYEHELLANPTLAGRVVVQFTIPESGRVGSARASQNTTGSDAVGRCVESAIRGMRFTPGPEGGSVDFSYPFIFAPQN